jgi:hypothetical protein
MRPELFVELIIEASKEISSPLLFDERVREIIDEHREDESTQDEELDFN